MSKENSCAPNKNGDSKCTEKVTRGSRNRRRCQLDVDAAAKSYCQAEIDPTYVSKEYIDDYIGFGVFANCDIEGGTFLLQYPGTLITEEEGENRETSYKQGNYGCYLFYFQHDSKQLCIDATLKEGLGKYVNDSSTQYANCQMKVKTFDDAPHLCLYATKNIKKDFELRYSYGENTGLSWRKLPLYKKPLNRKDYLSNSQKDNAMPVNDCDELQVCDTIEEIEPFHNLNREDSSMSVDDHEKDQNCDHVAGNYDFSIQYQDVSGVIHITDGDKGATHIQEENIFQNCVGCVKQTEKPVWCSSDQCEDFGLTFCPSCLDDHVCKKKLGNLDMDEATEAVRYLQNNPLPEFCCPIINYDDKGGLATEVESVDLVLKNDAQANIKKSVALKSDIEMESNVTREKFIEDNVQVTTNFVEELSQMMKIKNISGGCRVFQKWVNDTRGKKTDLTIFFRPKSTCPVCNEERIDLKIHLMKIHGMDAPRALGIKSQQNMYKEKERLPLEKRKSKPRFYTRKVCPVKNCHKVVRRIENHLKQTHKIKDNVVYRKLLKAAIPEADVLNDTHNASDEHSSGTSDENEMEYKDFKRLVRRNASDIKQIGARKVLSANDPDDDPYDPDDPDWLVVKLTDAVKYKNKRKNRLTGKGTGASNLYPGKSVLDGNSEDDSASIYGEGHSPVGANDITLQMNDGSQQQQDEASIVSEDSEDDEDEALELTMTPKHASDLILKFKLWLQSVDGRLKNDRSATQCSRQVLLVLKMVSPGTFTIESLFNRLLLRDFWLSLFDATKQPGTIRTYLNSLKLFYQFILCDQPDGILARKEECHGMCTIMSNWSASYSTKVKLRRNEKQGDDLGKLLSDEEIHQFDNSELVDDCRSMLKKIWMGGKPPSIRSFTLVRDYIITSLVLSNASRPGAIRNMTLGEFDKFTLSSEGVHLVRVKNHKTAATSGSRVIAFTKLLFQECQSFIAIRNMLPGISKRSNEAVFVSWAGRSMSSALVNDQFSSFFKRATLVDLDRKLTATLVRKSFVSKVHSAVPELKKDLANMMCHSEQTAAKSYFLQEKTRNVGNTFTRMQKVLRSNNIGIHERDQSSKVEVNSGDELPNEGNAEISEEDATEILEPTSDGMDSDEPKTSRRISRITYTRKEEIIILRCFKEVINNFGTVRSKDVQRIIKKYPEMIEIHEKYGLRRILVKVRTEKAKKKEISMILDDILVYIKPFPSITDY